MEIVYKIQILTTYGMVSELIFVIFAERISKRKKLHIRRKF